MDCNNIPTTGDHVITPVSLESALSGSTAASFSSSSSSVGGSGDVVVCQHHMLVTTPARVVYADGVRCYKINVIELNVDGFCEKEKTVKPGEFAILYYRSRYTGDDAVQHARSIRKRRSREGRNIYSLWGYNCESFVIEAKTGHSRSYQVIRAISAVAPLGAFVGGVVGSFVPVVGTLAGATVGGVAAGLFIFMLGAMPRDSRQRV